MTLAPLIRLLDLDRSDENARELARARYQLAAAAIKQFEGVTGQAADNLRFEYRARQQAAAEPPE